MKEKAAKKALSKKTYSLADLSSQQQSDIEKIQEEQRNEVDQMTPA